MKRFMKSVMCVSKKALSPLLIRPFILGWKAHYYWTHPEASTRECECRLNEECDIFGAKLNDEKLVEVPEYNHGWPFWARLSYLYDQMVINGGTREELSFVNNILAEDPSYIPYSWLAKVHQLEDKYYGCETANIWHTEGRWG